SERLTVRGDHRVFPHHVLDGEGAADLGSRPEVGGVGILSDLAQGNALAPSGDEQRNMRLLHWPKGDLDRLDLEMFAGKGERSSAPDSLQDLDDLFQRFLPLADAAHGQTQLREFEGE